MGRAPDAEHEYKQEAPRGKENDSIQILNKQAMHDAIFDEVSPNAVTTP